MEKDRKELNIKEMEQASGGLRTEFLNDEELATYLRLKDLGSTDIRCNVEADQFGCDSIEIILGGDAELETMKEALRWMLSVLETQSEMEA